MFAVFSNVVSSVALIVSNKQLVERHEFDYMVVLTGIHFYTSFLCCLLALLFGALHYKMVSNHMHLLRISVASLTSIIFMNLNLAHNSVAFYQISKLCCIPVTLFIESIFGLRKQQLTGLLAVSLLLIMGGMALVSEGEVEYSPEGLVYMSLGILGTSVGQIWFAPLQKELNLNSLQMLFHTSPIIAFSCFMLTPVVEDTPRLLDVDLTFPLVLNLFGSSMMAFFLNLSGYQVLQLTSPLTYQVVGHVKTILILLFGMLYFDRTPSSRVVTGVAVGMAGVLLYNVSLSQSKSKSGTVDDSEGDDEEVEMVMKDKRQKLQEQTKEGTFLASTRQLPRLTTQGWLKSGVSSLEAAGEVHRRLESRQNSLSLQNLFDRASKAVADKDTRWSSQPTIEDKTRMYALFKFVRSGACTDDSGRPSVFDPVARAKWDAWHALSNKHSHEEAQMLYVDLVRKFVDLQEE